MSKSIKQERKLQVYYQNRFEKNNPGCNNIQFPLIKFSGYWLKEAGFDYLDKLQVIVNDVQIIINKLGI